MVALPKYWRSYPQWEIAHKKSGGYNHTPPYPTSVDIIEALSGIDFLSKLPDDSEEAIDAGMTPRHDELDHFLCDSPFPQEHPQHFVLKELFQGLRLQCWGYLE